MSAGNLEALHVCCLAYEWYHWYDVISCSPWDRSFRSYQSPPGWIILVNICFPLLCKASAASNYMLLGPNFGSVRFWMANLSKDATEILIRPYFSFMIPAGCHEYKDKVRDAEDVKKSNSLIRTCTARLVITLILQFLVRLWHKSFCRGQTIFKMGKWGN